ncbi:MAG: SDR family NAD(P)-dependent oxidoreductase [Actinobacteria bacterium]|nr:SDR family NAD(P)-dependent oxidoreductase [Actinomycetota bacterium]
MWSCYYINNKNNVADCEVVTMKNMLITGGAGGIGSTVSTFFSQKGWMVYSCDIAPQTPLDKNIIPVATDIRSAGSVATARSLVEKYTDHLDVIIHLAGIYIMDSLIEIPEEDFIRMFDINVNGAYRVNKEFLPLVKNGGRIIIITSELSCLQPLPFNGIYSITKSTLEAYAHSLRLELALIDIPVITIRPGAVDTKLLSDSFTSMEKMCEKTRLYRANAIKFRNIMNKTTKAPLSPDKLAEVIYNVAASPHPKAFYTIGAGFGLKMFSALPASTQAILLKKLLK